MSQTQSPFLFLELVESLKNISRRGWVIRGVPNPESVADHMYRMAIMSNMAPGFDEESRHKAIRMALVHDIGEAIIGDITPSDGISREEKHVREKLAVEFVACTLRLADPLYADEIVDLWSEYEQAETAVARLVHQIDKLECIDQAIIYEERSGKDMSEFMALKKEVTLPELQPWLERRLQDYDEQRLRNSSDIQIIFVSGGPGVGKGTQCRLLVEEFGCYHISVGDALRAEASDLSSPYQEVIRESIEKSVLLPAQLTTLLVRKKIDAARAEGYRTFLLDGFPRNVLQAKDFKVKIYNRFDTLSFVCSEVELRHRLESRAESSERTDDNLDTILLRLRTFQENNSPVLRFLEQQGPVHEVECNGSVQHVYTSVRKLFTQILQRRD